jgi:DNA-binding CsgD family transcriptional regulator
MYKKAGAVEAAGAKRIVNSLTRLQGDSNYNASADAIPQSDFTRIKESLSGKPSANFFALKLMWDQLTEKIADTENLLTQVLDLAEDGIVIFNSRLYPIYWNSKVEEMGLNYDGNSGSLDTILDIEKTPGLRVQINQLRGGPPSAGTAHSPYFLLTIHKPDKYQEAMHPGASEEKCLTPREMEVLHFVRRGLTNKEIGKKMCISLPTVATHLRHIFRKLGVGRRANLICSLVPEPK